MHAARRGIVARPAQPHVDAQPLALAHDIRLGHMLERRMDREALALDARLGGDLRQPFERRDELRPAVGIARIIQRIDPDEQVARARRLRPAEREAEEDRIARRDIGDGNAAALFGADAILGHGDIVGQRRSAEGRQVERQDDVAFGAEHIGDAARGRQLDTVALVIIHRQREHAISLLPRAGGGDHRVEPAGDEHDGQRCGLVLVHHDPPPARRIAAKRKGPHGGRGPQREGRKRPFREKSVRR